MDLGQVLGSSGLLPYCGILIAAIVEGEVGYIAGATMVAQGRLDPVGVLVSGALGAAIGDQACFFAFRGRLPRWMARYPKLEQRAAPLVNRVRRHDSLMVLLIRFVPGLRIAIAAACAWADVSPWKFSILNLVSSFVWAFALLVLIGWLGPTSLTHIGLEGWTGALVIGVATLVGLKLFGSYERRAMERPDGQ
jgi:membrane protein DedA with SNARE-associated domain